VPACSVISPFGLINPVSLNFLASLKNSLILKGFSNLPKNSPSLEVLGIPFAFNKSKAFLASFVASTLTVPSLLAFNESGLTSLKIFL